MTEFVIGTAKRDIARGESLCLHIRDDGLAVSSDIEIRKGLAFLDRDELNKVRKENGNGNGKTDIWGT